MSSRQFGTCFFEQYAQIALATFLGGEMASLVNRDQPDLQSPDERTVGIKVTRAMEKSKVSKVGNDFYGHFDRMGLFVFSRENLGEKEATDAMNYTLFLQKYQDERYDWLFLADINDLFVCNLGNGLKESSRLERFPITQTQRQAFYLEAIRRQNESVQL